MKRTHSLPLPMHASFGLDVCRYTYADYETAKRASAIAETKGVAMCMKGRKFVYDLPGSIERNKDNTFTVIVPS